MTTPRSWEFVQQELPFEAEGEAPEGSQAGVVPLPHGGYFVLEAEEDV